MSESFFVPYSYSPFDVVYDAASEKLAGWMGKNGYEN